MGIWRSMDGLVTVKVTSADILRTLDRLRTSGVVLFHIQMPDDLTAIIQIRRRDFRTVAAITGNGAASLDITGRQGLYWFGKFLLERKLLITGLVLMISLMVFLPTRVLFVRVEGNIHVPEQLIIEKASDCGIGFFASRREVRSEKMKNALLAAIPELQWAGVNTSGCTAVISVRERSDVLQEKESFGVSRIVASRDALITSVTVTRGSGLCIVGQAVKNGQTLISGYTDCGISIRADRAIGEIFGLTRWETAAVTGKSERVRTENKGRTKKYALFIGKKRINFYKDSGISGSTCVKMYKEIYVTLPGGFRLPVKLVIESWEQWESAKSAVTPEDALNLLESFVASYLPGQMVAGEILSKDAYLMTEEEVYRLDGQYECHEMIGRERSEEIIHGKTN